MARKLLLLVVVILASCATPFTLVEPSRHDVGGGLAVQPTFRWNQVGMPSVEGRVTVWTLDGPALNDLMFIGGVPDGEPLFRPRMAPGTGGKDEKPPAFRRTMTSVELQELFQATIARSFNTTISDVANLKPATFVGAPGFRFDTKFVGRDEVERYGTVVGVVREGKFYAIWFYGARLHYFERYLPEFERIVASARLAG